MPSYTLHTLHDCFTYIRISQITCSATQHTRTYMCAQCAYRQVFGDSLVQQAYTHTFINLRVFVVCDHYFLFGCRVQCTFDSFNVYFLSHSASTKHTNTHTHIIIYYGLAWKYHSKRMKNWKPNARTHIHTEMCRHTNDSEPLGSWYS